MNKGLEALENIKIDMEYVTRLDFVEPVVRGEVQQRLYKIYHRETPELEIIEKELKALEIIKNKNVLPNFVLTWELNFYNKVCVPQEQLTQEEYDLLREVLQCNTLKN